MSKPVALKDVAVEAMKALGDRQPEQFEPYDNPSCYPDCEICGGDGVHLVHAEENRWDSCPNRDDWERAKFWKKRPKLFGLEDVKLDGKLATDIMLGTKTKPWQTKAFRFARDLLNEEPPTSWALITGGYGTGKTHLLIAIVNESRLAGKAATFTTAGNILTQIQDTFNSKKSAGDVRRRYEGVPLLCLDEIDRVNWSQWAGTELFSLINNRHLRNLSTVMSSNLLPRELEAKAEPLAAILSRLTSKGDVYHLQGKDLRPEQRK